MVIFYQESANYASELVKPVLTCFADADSRVRYYGCEALYNIVKVARGAVLPFFNEIFDGLSRVSHPAVCNAFNSKLDMYYKICNLDLFIISNMTVQCKWSKMY